MAGDRPRAFLDISIGTEPSGRIEIELYRDRTPKTCANFLALCTQNPPDLTYRGSSFHRVVEDFIIQGGDVTRGDGTGGKSIYGGDFEDEALNWREIDTAGLVCMANRGAKHTNSSQFFITVDNYESLSGKSTVFGRIVKGLDLVKRISKVDVDAEGDYKPTTPVIISNCGELERIHRGRHMAPAPSTAEATVIDSSTSTDDSRGRRKRHRDTMSPHSGSSMPSRSTKRHHRHSSGAPMDAARLSGHTRRDSENKRDETFRGRARTSTPLPEAGESSSKERKREQRDSSPSRPPKPTDEDTEMDGVADGIEGKRRRKSLPNHKQYYDQKERRYEQSGRDGYDRRGPGGGERGRYEGENVRDRNYRHDREVHGPRRSRGYEDEGENMVHQGGVRLKGRGMMKYREQKEPGRL